MRVGEDDINKTQSASSKNLLLSEIHDSSE